MSVPNWIRAVAFLAAGLGILAAASYFLTVGQMTGSKTVTAFAMLVAFGPLAIYAAIRNPVVFPFCLFVIVVPFDELFVLPGFGTVARLLAILSALALAFWLVRTKRLNPPPQPLIWWSALFAWMVLSIAWALDPTLAVGRLSTVIQLLGLYTIVALLPITVKQLKAVLFASALGGVIAAGYGAYYLHENLNKIMRLLLTNGENVADPNHFSAALILPVAIVTVMALTTRSLWLKLLLSAADVILFAGVYASGSRGSFLAVAVVFVYLFWMASAQRLQLLVVGGLGVLASFLTPTSIWARFQIAVSSGGAGREEIWRVGLGAFKQFWLYGAGLENFTVAYDRAYIRTLQAVHMGWSRAAHDLLFQFAVELGVIGLFFVLAAWASQVTILNVIPRSSPLFPYRLMAQSATLGLFFAALFLDVLYRKYTWLTFMVAVLVQSAWRNEGLRRVASEYSVALGPQRWVPATRVEEELVH